MYAIDALRIGYGRNVLSTLERVVVEPGEFICLLGRNGQGKSTLLRTLAGFIPAVDGEVRLDGRPVRQWPAAERARKVAVVLTDRPQVGALRVHELVEMGRQPYTGWTGALSHEDREICESALKQVEGEHLRDRFVDSLSDGERQRVMIARALAQRPQVMLLDEITAFLDLPSRVTITATLRRIARETGVSIILSSHDLELSLNAADRIWLLPGEGRFIDGAPEDVALSGAIGEAFDQANLAFSLTSGRFETRGSARGTAFIDAEGAASIWLQRAVERIGFARVASERGAAVVIRRAADGFVFDGARHPFIRDLVRAIDHRNPADLSKVGADAAM
ncbi:MULTISPECIES: ABC transporter ATP-binding protein [unclassified Brevundimonas]|uniref:ABC transporter ATP-binding protein n=1 Tax=unclassified Brevundimonas TaxID=2622653 RepID=UPI000E942144|nr:MULTISPECIES: ABC transporter ATP-binding protein [unclassified Brevundimonas]MCK6103547.1 ABC transporter ATP-binding protein [Brevundimonas sp. EYE_349]HBI20564.1 ABC transporter ATP-binding protein [Brevundimonas sp.]